MHYWTMNGPLLSEIRSRALPWTVYKSVSRAPGSMERYDQSTLAEYSINIKGSTEYQNCFLC